MTNEVGKVGQALKKAAAAVADKAGRAKSLFYKQDETPLIPVTVLGLTRLYGVDAEGNISANSRDLNLDFFKSRYLSQPPADSQLTLDVGGRKPVVLSHGAGCVLGMPDSGKTLFSNTLRDRNEGVIVIRFQEPEDDSLLYEAAFVKELARALDSSAKVIFVDSLRTTFYTATGSTGKGGVNMGIFALLTAFDILARRAGKTILFSLNPMTNDAEAISFYLDAARGSVSHTFHAIAPTKMRVSSRALQDRNWYDIKYEPVKPKQNAAPVKSAEPLDLDAEARSSIIDLYTITL